MDENRSAHVEELEDDEFQDYFDSNSYAEEFEDWYDLSDDSGESLEGEKQGANFSTSSAKKLYNGCPLSVSESMVLILLFSLRHSITGECLADLLTLITLHFALPNLCTSSLYLFRKYFKDMKSPLIFHKFCSYCFSPIDCEGGSNCLVCQKEVNDETVSYFIECPVVNQVINLFKREDFYTALQHRFKRHKKGQQTVEDIYDGNLYKKHCENQGFLSSVNNISLMWYTDGVPLFESSKYSIWPLYFVINELPYQMRMSKTNIIFGGIWFGEHKPLFHIFLKPSIVSINKLYKGVEVTLPDTSRITVRGMLLCGTCDLPAKSLVLNMNQFNGKFGCSKCLESGETVAAGRGNTRVYPFAMKPEKRSHEQFVQDGKTALQTSQIVNGVKGPSWLSVCYSTDIVRGTSIDYMHCILLGIVRKFLKLWFDSAYSKEHFSMNKILNKVEERLLNIQPPNVISRTPRSIKHHSKFWKANECRAWLFVYSVPVLYGLMDNIYFEHYCLLVEGIFLLSSECVTQAEINKSEKLLQHFCYMFEVLYGKRHMSANMHQVLHLADCVRDLGPLWVYSCFKFEDLNGQLVKMFHGTKNPEIQICNTLSTLVNLPSILLDLPSKGHLIFDNFLSQLQGTKRKCVSGIKISDDCWILGSLSRFSPSESLQLKLNRQCKGKFSKFNIFSRLHKNGLTFHSQKYKQVTKRNSFTVFYSGFGESNRCGQIEYFLKCCNCTTERCDAASCNALVVAVVQYLPIIPFRFLVDEITNCSLSHVFKVSTDDKHVDIVPMENILSLSVFLPVTNDENTAYVSRVPKLIERD